MSSQITRTRASTCPRCRTEIDSHRCVSENAQPKAGDVTVCAYCGQLLVFDEGLQLREATAQERLELQRLPDVWREIVRLTQHPPLQRKKG